MQYKNSDMSFISHYYRIACSAFGHAAIARRHGIRSPFPGAAIPSVRRYIHNAYATPYEISLY